MIIGVDLRPLASGRQSGIEQYIKQLLPAMISQASAEVEFKLFFSSWKEMALTADWLKAPAVKLYRFFYSNRWLFLRSRLWSRPRLDRLIKGADVFFSPHFFLAPLSRRCRSVITFHDLSFERYPEFFPRRAHFWHRWGMNPQKQAQKADHLIAVSASTRNDLISLWGISETKITVIYSGPGEMKLYRDNWRHDSAEIKRVRTRYHLPGNFFLFFGALEPRKNVSGVLRALELLYRRQLLPPDYYLVIAGEKGWQTEKMEKILRFSPVRSRIIFSGPVDEQDKLLVYSLASVFVYPSFFEGFGFPVLEAMTAGVPVITSQTSSLPEVASGAAWLVNPYSISDIAQAMQKLATDHLLVDHFRQKGLENAKRFSWEETARKTLETILAVSRK